MNSKWNFRGLGLALLGASLLFVASDSAAFVEGTPVDAVIIECGDPEIRSEAIDFFTPRLRGPYSAEAVSAAIKKFQVDWPVHTIGVWGEEIPAGLRLRVNVDVRPIVTSIRIEGGRSLKKGDILSQIDLARGERAVPSLLERVRKRVADYLLYRGFPEVEVAVEVEPRGDSREAAVLIRIWQGDPCAVSSVEIPFERELLGIAPGDRCDGRVLAEGVRRIRGKLRDQGHLSADVGEGEMIYAPDRRSAAVAVRVVPGPRVEVRFEGNTFYFERDALLRKTVFFEEERQFNQGWIDGAAKEGIRQFYASQGYPDARVDVDERGDGASRTIVFRIDRGEPLRLGKIEFRGNSAVPEGDLLRHFRAVAPPMTRKGFLVREDLPSVSEAVVAYYQQQGFLRAKVPPPEIAIRSSDRRADLLFRIEEGKRSTIGSLRVEGNRALPTGEILDRFSFFPGDPVDPLLLRQRADRVEEEYRRIGYKFVKLNLPPPEEIPEGGVDYLVRVEEGPEVAIGEIRVRGNLHTREKVIRRELTFEEGDRYDPEKLKESRRKLLRLGFFESVSLDEHPIDPRTKSEGIGITVSERKKRTLAFRPGFSTDEGYRGAMEFGYVNIGGTGRSATASGRVSRQFDDPDIVEHRVVLTYLEPHLFNLADGKVHFIDERAEEKQFDIDRRSVILGLERSVRKWLRAAVQWELEYRDPFNLQPGAVLSPIDQTSARFGSVASILDFDFRNDPLNPTRGSFHRLQASLYNQSLLSEADFMQVYVRNSFYLPIHKRVRSVLSVRAGFSATYGQTKTDGITEIPIEKRFRLGGNSTLRGFGRNCIGGLGHDVAENCSDATLNEAPGGNAVFNYMFDLLFPLFKGFDFALFTDGGNAYLANGGFNPFDIRTTAGAGIRYNTFFGPLRLDYGIKLDRRSGESFGEIHFAVGQF